MNPLILKFLESIGEDLDLASNTLAKFLNEFLEWTGIEKEKKPVAVPENPNPAPATETKSPDSVSASPDSSTEKAISEISESIETPTANTNESIDEAIKKEG